MSELAKAVQKKYIDDLVSKYPLHRFIVLFVFLIAFYIQYELQNPRIITGLGDIKISFIFDFSKGLLSFITVKQLLFGIFLTYITKYIYKLFSEKFFNFLSNSNDFEQYTSEIIERVKATKSSDGLVNYYVSRDVSSELEKSRAQLKSSSAGCEILSAISIGVALGGIHIEFFDLVVIVVLIAIVCWGQWVNFKFYISNFIPYYLTEKTLLGSNAKFGDL